MKKIFKLGWVLVIEGLISRQQLEKALLIQQKHPTRSIGEIINKLYDVSAGKIEALFINRILIPSITNWLYSELEKKISINNQPLKQIIPEIVVQISTYIRHTVSSLSFSLTDKNDFRPHTQKKFLSTISCTIDRIVLQTLFKEEITFEKVRIEYDVQSQKISWTNTSLITESKIRLNQIVKKNSNLKQDP